MSPINARNQLRHGFGDPILADYVIDGQAQRIRVIKLTRQRIEGTWRLHGINGELVTLPENRFTLVKE